MKSMVTKYTSPSCRASYVRYVKTFEVQQWAGVTDWCY